MTQSNIDKLKEAKRALYMAREALSDVCIRTPLGQDEYAISIIFNARVSVDSAYMRVLSALEQV